VICFSFTWNPKISKDSHAVFNLDPFDLWYKEEIKKNAGADFSQTSSDPLPELLISYDKSIL